MQMAKTQEALIRNNFITLDLGLKRFRIWLVMQHHHQLITQ